MSEPPQRPQRVDPNNLLKWSVASSGQDGENSIQQIAQDIQAGRRQDLSDPGLYNALMGKSEGQMMKEELSVAINSNKSEQDRIQALDNFELLIEQIDNANNITNMKMWQPLISLLEENDQTLTTPLIQLQTLWILGTAVQNNDKAQMAILEFDPLKSILYLLQHSSNAQVRSKAMYALSGILKHNAKAVDIFVKENGFIALLNALQDPDISLRRKAAFFVNTLLLQDDDDDDDHNDQERNSIQTSINANESLSRSTAIAPLSNNSADSNLPRAPLEQPPATHMSGIKHPSIAPLLIESGLISTLIVSLLDSEILSNLPENIISNIDVAANSVGPNGDIELRQDEDYSEKATRACFTFLDKISNKKYSIDENNLIKIKSLLFALEKELKSKNFQEFGISKSEMDSFSLQVKNL